MLLAAKYLATLLVAFIVLVQPFRGRSRYEDLVRRVKTDQFARTRHYRRGIVGEWLYVSLVVVIVFLAAGNARSIGLTLNHLKPGGTFISVEIVAIVFMATAVTTIEVRRPNSKLLPRFRRQAQRFVELIPRTREERRMFSVLAVSAGICEEIVFRGFGIMYFRLMFPGTNSVIIVLCLGAVFGLVHAYQGVRNVLLLGALGCGFAWMVLATGTIVAAVAVHALIDLRVAFLPTSITERPEMAEQSGLVEPRAVKTPSSLAKRTLASLLFLGAFIYVIGALSRHTSACPKARPFTSVSTNTTNVEAVGVFKIGTTEAAADRYSASFLGENMGCLAFSGITTTASGSLVMYVYELPSNFPYTQAHVLGSLEKSGLFSSVAKH